MIASGALALVLKATIVLGAGLAAGRLLRRRSAATRHRLWSATFAAALALPMLAFIVPRVRVPVPGWRQDTAMPTTVDAEHVSRHRAPDPTASPAPRTPIDSRRSAAIEIERSTAHVPVPSPLVVLGACWIIGALVVLARLALALHRAARLASSSRELGEATWHAACRRLGDALGVRARVRLVVSRDVSTPMAGGLAHPTIFLPRSAPSWPDDVRDVVLAHELAHLASRDPIRHLVSRAALAVYWFHPFAWLAARRAVASCEQACDDAVLTLGIRPSTYAGVLLDFASAGAAPTFAAALPIVRPSQLEDRLMAILNSSRRANGAIRRRSAIATLAIAAVATPLIAAIEPARVGAPAPSANVRGGVIPMVASRNAYDVAPPRTEPRRVIEPRTLVMAEDACTWDSNGRSFSGSSTVIETGGATVVQRRVGTVDGDRVIQTSLGDLRVCAVAEGVGSDTSDVPSGWLTHASRVLLETRRAGDVRRMDIAGGRTTWTVNDETRPVDAAAAAWRDRLLAFLDPTWQLSQLRGRVSSLRGEISSIMGQRSSLEGEISSLRGHVSSMQGEISSVRGQVSSMEGEISSVRGHLSSLRGEISSERGAISSLESSGGTDAAIRRHEDNIRAIEGEIASYDADGRVRRIEGRIAAFNADSQVAAIEQRLRTFNVDSQVAAVQRRIASLDVNGQVAGIEREIDALHADDRGRDLQTRIDAAERRLRDVLGGR